MVIKYRTNNLLRGNDTSSSLRSAIYRYLIELPKGYVLCDVFVMDISAD